MVAAAGSTLLKVEEGSTGERRRTMVSQDRSRCVALGMLMVVLTVAGLVAMSQVGGLGSFGFSLYAPLWVLFGAGVMFDCFRTAFRRTTR
jgi:hypothetical protein